MRLRPGCRGSPWRFESVRDGTMCAEQATAPGGLTAQADGQQAGTPQVQVAVRLPCVADAAVQVQPFFGGEYQGLGGAQARRCRGPRERRLVVEQRPGTEVGVGARELV